MENVYKTGHLKVLLDYAFPACDCQDAQYQALSVIRSLGTRPEFRYKLLEEGVLEPLMLTCHRRDVDFELKRQATAALCNLTLTSAKSSTIARSGVISALISVAKDSIDVDINCQVLAVAALANLVEAGGANVSKRLVDEGCDILIVKLAASSQHEEFLIEISRLIALLSCHQEVHERLITETCLAEIIRFAGLNEDEKCRR